MIVKERTRLGGRSARIQASVHQAVKDLSAQVERAELTVPLIAAKAGVTPSTIYRRWGDLSELLADVAVERLRPTFEPIDTGALKTDLQAWAEQYMEEMSSEVGRAMIRDVFASPSDTKSVGQCCGFTYDQLNFISARAVARGEAGFDVDEIIDHVVAPIMYRILFATTPHSVADCHALVDRVFRAPR